MDVRKWCLHKIQEIPTFPIDEPRCEAVADAFIQAITKLVDALMVAAPRTTLNGVETDHITIPEASRRLFNQAATLNSLTDKIYKLEAEIAALKEPMACGHPKACIEIRQYDYGDNVKDSATGKPPTVSAQFCTACEHERLVRTAALREAIEIIELSPTFKAHSDRPSLCWCEICTYIRGNVTEIRARLIPPSDQKALDAHDAEVRAPLVAALEQAKHAFIEGSPTLCIIEDALRGSK